jgi:ferredoxin
MVKRVKIEPLAKETEVLTNSNLLSALMEQELHVIKACGGRGLCATCHVFVRKGQDALSPASSRETRTLQVITGANEYSRLACQARVVGEGVVVELPVGMYVTSLEDIFVLVGRRAEEPLLHPVTGRTLVEQSQIITRSMLKQLEGEDFSIGETLSGTTKA